MKIHKVRLKSLTLNGASNDRGSFLEEARNPFIVKNKWVES